MLNLSKYNDEAAMKLYEKSEFITEMIVKHQPYKFNRRHSLLRIRIKL